MVCTSCGALGFSGVYPEPSSPTTRRAALWTLWVCRGLAVYLSVDVYLCAVRVEGLAATSSLSICRHLPLRCPGPSSAACLKPSLCSRVVIDRPRAPRRPLARAATAGEERRSIYEALKPLSPVRTHARASRRGGRDRSAGGTVCLSARNVGPHTAAHLAQLRVGRSHPRLRLVYVLVLSLHLLVHLLRSRRTGRWVLSLLGAWDAEVLQPQESLGFGFRVWVQTIKTLNPQPGR
jgi:hypothetical protein